MFKENRKLVDSWTFDWFNQRTGQQLIRMKLYECSGFLATSKYVIEFENKCGFVFHSENYVSVSDSLLMGYFFEIHMAIIMDKYILGEDEGFCFNQIKKADFEVMNSLYWSEFNETYPNGNGWNFNPRTNPTSTFPPQNFPVIQHLQFLHIYCGYYKFSNSTELG